MNDTLRKSIMAIGGETGNEDGPAGCATKSLRQQLIYNSRHSSDTIQCTTIATCTFYTVYTLHCVHTRYSGQRPPRIAFIVTLCVVHGTAISVSMLRPVFSKYLYTRLITGSTTPCSRDAPPRSIWHPGGMYVPCPSPRGHTLTHSPHGRLSQQ
jgi:hypothetical protein